MYIRVKTSIESYMNKQIQIFEDVHALKEDIAQGKIEDLDEVYDRLNSLNFGAIGVEEHVIQGYLKDLAERAIELKDEKLLEYLQGLFLVTEC